MRHPIPLLLAAALAAAAARAPAQEPFEQQVSETTPKVEAAIGLKFKRPVRFEVRSRAEMRRMLAAMLSAERSAHELAAEQSVYRLLGVIPDTLDWARLELDLLAEQVVGFYDPHTKILSLQDDPDDPTLGIVVAHELVHALQDQYMDVDSVLRIKGDDDRVLAATAALEGQATLVSFEIALGLGPDFPGSEEAIHESVRSGMEDQPVIATAPAFVKALEIFPYLSGMEWMLRFERARPGERPYGAALPTSTAQIERPALYFDGPRREPLSVTLPPPAGAELIYENDLGAFASRVMLDVRLRDAKRAARATVGWAGDRYQLLRTPQGDGLRWLTVWETAADADAFRAAMQKAADRRDRAWHAARAATVRRVDVSGHPAVLYLDLPVGASPVPLDSAAGRIE